LTKKDWLLLNNLKDNFNYPEYNLTPYASLNEKTKNELIQKGNALIKAAKNAKKEDRDQLEYEAAEINSGVPALEAAIREYLDKYALTIKIKSIHDAFMTKVNELAMLDNCQKEWTASDQAFEKAKKEIDQKRAQCNHEEKLKEFKQEVEFIKFDKKALTDVRKNFNDAIGLLLKEYSVGKDMELSEAKHFVVQLNDESARIYQNGIVGVQNILRKNVDDVCKKIIMEYAEYIKELEGEGVFNIDNYDVSKTDFFKEFKTIDPDTLIEAKDYITDKRVQDGTQEVEEDGVWGWFKRRLPGHFGYEIVPKYVHKNFVDMEGFLREKFGETHKQFDDDVKAAGKYYETKVNNMKDFTSRKLMDLDKQLKDEYDRLAKMMESKQKLEKEVANNREKMQWLKNFIDDVDNILSIGEE
jgi:hypothetical protein